MKHATRRLHNKYICIICIVEVLVCSWYYSEKIVVGTTIFPATFPAHHERRHATVRAVREVPYRYHRKWVVRTSTGINGTRNSSNVDSM